jgi:prophage maintenance system killer protein
MQAAVLAHGIAEGQPFIDANKGTALAALRTFLRLNGSAQSLRNRQHVLLIRGGRPSS